MKKACITGTAVLVDILPDDISTPHIYGDMIGYAYAPTHACAYLLEDIYAYRSLYK